MKKLTPEKLDLAPSVKPRHRIAVVHTFETAHRLPNLDGKCASLHGHSWQVAVSVTAPGLTEDATIVEFGALKAGIRRWIDTYFDHGTMLGSGDVLLTPLTEAKTKVFRFGYADPHSPAESLASDLPWPTVEAVAVVLHRVSQQVLAHLPHTTGALVGEVVVHETRHNTAAYGSAGER
ncbi:6-pyruvoyl tetrahydropterin synthase family protein [Amycolatopsis sp. NPDC059657]|uniref:6-pyruvoyl trahydropterin synthase family protein n=1 Tax=Amycolatopsis sp. NPDC059657 TaxID=3346899 RepID=UPI00366E6F61